MIGKLTKEQIEILLKNNTIGRLACNDGFNTYIYPVSYFYDGKYIVCHSFPGSKIAVMRQNKRVCFLVDQIENFSCWKSVMIHGDYQEIDSERERFYAIKEFAERMLYIKITEPGSAVEDAAKKNRTAGKSKPIIYRILIDEKTGRRENEDPYL